ncbi:MAG: hypothetical protein RDV41_09525, partial [Planctomycetota bacterium]|nr:hypothetical protein [Planctomycetota bacterium]
MGHKQKLIMWVAGYALAIIGLGIGSYYVKFVLLKKSEEQVQQQEKVLANLREKRDKIDGL